MNNKRTYYVTYCIVHVAHDVNVHEFPLEMHPMRTRHCSSFAPKSDSLKNNKRGSQSKVIGTLKCLILNLWRTCP